MHILKNSSIKIKNSSKTIKYETNAARRITIQKVKKTVSNSRIFMQKDASKFEYLDGAEKKNQE